MRTASSSSTSRIVGDESGIGGGACRARERDRFERSPSYYSPAHDTDSTSGSAAGGRAAGRSNGRSTAASTAPRSCRARPAAPARRLSAHAAGVLAGPARCRRTSTVPARGRSPPSSPRAIPTARRAAPGRSAPRTGSSRELPALGLPRLERHLEPARCPAAATSALENVWAVAAGQSRDAIVVMAHRDDTGVGPGRERQRERHGGARRARAGLCGDDRGRCAGGAAGAHARVPVDGRRRRRAASAPSGSRSACPIRWTPSSTSIRTRRTRRTAPRSSPAMHRAHRGPAADHDRGQRIAEQTGQAVRRPTVLAQLIDLAFPFTLGEQGPFVARGMPAVTVTTGGERPAEAFADRPKSLDVPHLTTLGRAAQELVGSLDQGLELMSEHAELRLGRRPRRPWLGDRAAADLPARPVRRRGGRPVRALPAAAASRSLPALRSLRSRIAFWLFAGLAFVVFGLLGAWPRGPARPPNPAVAATGDWAVLAAARCSARRWRSSG